MVSHLSVYLSYFDNDIALSALILESILPKGVWLVFILVGYSGVGRYVIVTCEWLSSLRQN